MWLLGDIVDTYGKVKQKLMLCGVKRNWPS